MDIWGVMVMFFSSKLHILHSFTSAWVQYTLVSFNVAVSCLSFQLKVNYHLCLCAVAHCMLHCIACEKFEQEKLVFCKIDYFTMKRG